MSFYNFIDFLDFKVLNRTMEPQRKHTPSQGDHLPFPHMGLPHMPPHMNPPLMPFLPTQPAPPMPPTGFMAGNAVRDCIRLRGLPFEATVTDILGFLGEHSRNIVFQGVHMVYNAAVSTWPFIYLCKYAMSTFFGHFLPSVAFFY